MTVSAPTADSGGAAILANVAAVQTLVNAAANPAVQSLLLQQLNALQTQAVDHFMATYWVSADQILATIVPPTNSRYGAYVTAQLAAISARAAQVATIVAAGLPAITMGNVAPQYSVAYPLTRVPDTYWYMLQVQLVDFCMANAIVTASQILSTMTGAQTYVFHYVSDYTFYQSDIEGQSP